GLEYVSALFYKELQAANFSEEAMAKWVEKSKAESEKYGLKNLLIMVDGQGDIAVPDEAERTKAVEN
ncbi:MAG TPA: xylose isomerase, partial [Muricauda sp.]|nr:xylose isomerase [Allomuricauda sp.]